MNTVENTNYENIISIFDYSGKKTQKQKKSLENSDLVKHGADPIKDLETLERVKSYILNNTGKYGIRNFMIFVFGLNVGRRCGDTLKLRIKDVFDFQRKEVKDKVVHVEQKTGKVMGFYIPEKLKPSLLDYIESLGNVNESDFLFRSQKGGSLGRKSYWAILKKVQDGLGLNLNLGTHSCRKTFGYFTFKALKEDDDAFALQTVRAMFGHFDERTTSRYIGLDDDVLKKGYNSVFL